MIIGRKNLAIDGVYIIAELSANHNQSFELAEQTVRAAARAGADAIKLQTYRADTITLNHDGPGFTSNPNGPWAGRTLYSLYEEAHTPWEWHAPLQGIATEVGLDFFSSPFDPTAVDLLESLGVPAYKIASFEITDIPLIEYVASKGKPVIVSTGIATDDDIGLAVEAIRRTGNTQIVVLKCTSSYPAPMDQANLVMIRDLQDRFGVMAGLSDHTMGITAPVLAVAFGAKVIEKHLILDRSLGGPDASFSLDELEFTAMVSAVRDAEKAVGRVDYTLTPSTTASRAYARSLYVVQDIPEGGLLTSENVRSIRPGHGLHPRHYVQVLGRRTTAALTKGTPLRWEDIESGA